MAAPPIYSLDTPLAELRGVGPERAGQLARPDVRTVRDLLRHRPRRYEDRRHFLTIAQLKLNESSTTRGKIVACGLKRWANGTKSVFEMILEDGTARLHCRWWNLPFMQNYFEIGDEVLVFGKPNSLKPRTIDHPETEIIEDEEDISIHLNRIAPIYPSTDGLPQRWLRSLVWRTLEEFRESMECEARDERLKISAPDAGTISRNAAFRAIHFPDELAGVDIARQRLALDELIELQWAIQIRRKKLEANARGLPCAGDNRLIRKFLSRLGFLLTDAQNKVLREIRRDLGGPHPMRRLLQGDVGSGKTIVAACSALMALESEFNVALMAPTEILAEQHYQNFKGWFAPLEIAVELLTGSVKTVEFKTQNSKLKTFFIGTHALIENSFAPENLGLVIIDEQHKFGVAQREKLLKKGNFPHLLVMTATPIPRTLGLTLYGDLDISVIDQLPAGRGKIKTFIRAQEKLPKVWEFVREKIQEGRQAYIVYPRIEDSGSGELKALVHEFDKLQKQFAPHRLGLLHGRLKSEEKEQVMKGFRANEIRALLATSVIEVGMDIPNATVMVIENAEQFGLAQLHQLRGRIGRGVLDS
ncbi:MAG: ATP-dependent DNA helicase RecG, partial [Limisphaerales bacterium]